MSAATALSRAQETGVRLEVAGNDLILEADKYPPPEILEMIRRHKLDIVALLKSRDRAWTALDWRQYFDERAAVPEYGRGQICPNGEAAAYESCLVEWLSDTRSPQIPEPAPGVVSGRGMAVLSCPLEVKATGIAGSILSAGIAGTTNVGRLPGARSRTLALRRRS